MKTVLVTQRLVEESAYPEVRQALDVRWGTVFAALGLVPVPMSIEIDPTEYEALNPAGVVLTGGNDLAQCEDTPLTRQRDAYERRVLRVAGKRSWPLFAVCRGMQFLAAEAGATLHTVEDHVARNHGLAVVADAPYSPLLSEVRRVNSFHRFAPTGALNKGWTVAARGEDGEIEAIASTDTRALGIMWHPERYETPRPCDLALIRAVFDL